MSRRTIPPLAAALAGVAFAVGAASSSAGPADRADDPPEARPADAPRSVITGDYAVMVWWCDLSEPQQSELEIRITAKNERLREHDRANADRQRDLRRRYQEARRRRDRDEADRLSAELRRLTEERRTLLGRLEDDILAILTDGQREDWKAYGRLDETVARYLRLDLSEDQRLDVRDLALDAARELGRIEHRRDRGEVVEMFREEIEEVVLTDEQRERLFGGGRRRDRAGEERVTPDAQKEQERQPTAADAADGADD